MRRSVLGIALAGLLVAVAGCKEEGTVRVHSLNFKGVQAVDAARLRDALATRQSDRLPWGKKAFFDRARFDADLKRIQAFYADRGYPDARVTGFDVKLNDKQDSVDITITIAEGEPVKVAAINFVGFDDVIPAPHFDTLKNQIPLKVGAPRDRALVVTTHEMALNELKDHGYPYAKVDTTEDDGPDGKIATVTFSAAPGKIAHIGPIEIQGNKTVTARVIERELTFKSGDLYQRSVLQDSQRRLYGLELFQFANIEPVNPELEPTEVPIRITVAEGKHQRVNFGVGYGTEEKARVDAEYHHVNFLGDARLAGVHARWSSLDRGLRLDFNQPYFFAPHFSFGAETQHWYTFTPAYQSIVTSTKATVTHKGTDKTSWALSLTNEHANSTIAQNVLGDSTLRNNLIALGLDPDSGEQRGTLNAMGFDLQHTTADSLLNAHHGYQVAFHAEQAGRFVPGTFNYYALAIDGRQYLPIGDTIVFASRLQLGNIRPVAGDPHNVPFSKKYFLGGATSLRGWGRYEVSPLSVPEPLCETCPPSGLPIGGNSLLSFSEELRADLRGRLGAVIFLDGGNVWADSWGVNVGDLRYAVGPGLRYQTPVGPIRFDVGYQLNPVPELRVNGEPQQRRWRIHFSIGQAF
jgi:outer membrane protein insertion porin family/translocation and assembly module TamA